MFNCTDSLNGITFSNSWAKMSFKFANVYLLINSLDKSQIMLSYIESEMSDPGIILLITDWDIIVYCSKYIMTCVQFTAYISL